MKRSHVASATSRRGCNSRNVVAFRATTKGSNPSSNNSEEQRHEAEGPLCLKQRRKRKRYGSGRWGGQERGNWLAGKSRGRD